MKLYNDGVELTLKISLFPIQLCTHVALKNNTGVIWKS